MVSTAMEWPASRFKPLYLLALCLAVYAAGVDSRLLSGLHNTGSGSLAASSWFEKAAGSRQFNAESTSSVVQDLQRTADDLLINDATDSLQVDSAVGGVPTTPNYSPSTEQLNIKESSCEESSPAESSVAQGFEVLRGDFISGGPTPSLADDSEVQTAAAQAIMLLNADEPMRTSSLGAGVGELQFVAVKSADKQVVAGTMFIMALSVTESSGDAFDIDVSAWFQAWATPAWALVSAQLA